MNELSLVFDRPAEAWNEALPLGNGSMGAMSYGRLRKEKVELNLDTLWSGQEEIKKTKIQMWTGSFCTRKFLMESMKRRKLIVKKTSLVTGQRAIFRQEICILIQMYLN